jgi:phosphate-selective porin
MLTLKSKWLALLAGVALTASAAMAQDSKALIDALVKKGVLTQDEAEKIAADVKKSEASMDVATSGSKYLKKLTISGRFQVQYAGFGASIDGAADPVYTSHFLLRRMYLGAKADMANGWSGTLNYDFANASFDAAFIEWKQSDALAVDLGFRKVPIGLEEWGTSSGSLKAIERSPATRYFVESNNGRRLGAGSYRLGAYAGGTQGILFYNVAITNPERDEFSSLNGNSDPGVQGSGSAATNSMAYWANAGIANKFAGGTYKFGASAGFLPDQGGTVLGKGDDLKVYSVYGVVTAGPWDVEGEYFWSQNEHGVSATRDADAKAYWIQPAFKLTPDLEAVVRYSFVDSDHRGVNISDGIRSAPSGGTMDKMEEWYAGLNWYLNGNDTKFQIGYIHGDSKDKVTGGSANATTDGVRSQIQVNF